MLSDDKITMMDITNMVDNLRLDLLQFGENYYEDEDELNNKIEILEEILDLCGSYLEL